MAPALRKSILIGLGAILIGSAGPGVAPARAQSDLRDLVLRIVPQAQLRQKHRRHRLFSRHRGFDGFEREDTDHPNALEGEYTRGLSGLYLPGYDMDGVLRYNYSGHRN